MSRRQEIKEKELLQLKFQQSLQQTNQKISQWLRPSTKPITVNRDLLDLPIIKQGGSLNDIESGLKISDFMTGDGKQMKQKMENKTHSSSKPMNSLMNKFKADKRNQVRNSPGRIQKGMQTAMQDAPKGIHAPRGMHAQKGMHKAMHHAQRGSIPLVTKGNDSSDSDSESEQEVRSIKKPKLLF